MRRPHRIVRRVALLAALIAGPTHAACSNEGPLAPEPAPRTVVPGTNHSGVVVGSGALDNPETGGSSADPVPADTSIATPDSATFEPKTHVGR